MKDTNITWTHLERVLNELGDAIIEQARRNLDANNSNATHLLYDNLGKVVKIPTDDDPSFSLSIALEDYWVYLEYGTGPQHVPDARDAYWPQIGPLKDWVAHKPGLPQVEGLAYAIRHAIRFGTKDHLGGTKPHPFFRPAVDEVLPRYEPLIDKAIMEDLDEWLLDALDG